MKIATTIQISQESTANNTICLSSFFEDHIIINRSVLPAEKSSFQTDLSPNTDKVAPSNPMSDKTNETFGTASAQGDSKQSSSLMEMLEIATAKISKKSKITREGAILNNIGSAPVTIKTGRWTVEEHEQFLEGISKRNKDWISVARYVPTRDISQVRSHAQKYLMKKGKDLPIPLKNTAIKKTEETSTCNKVDESKTSENKETETIPSVPLLDAKVVGKNSQRVCLPSLNLVCPIPVRPVWTMRPNVLHQSAFVPTNSNFAFSPSCRILLPMPMHFPQRK